MTKWPVEEAEMAGLYLLGLLACVVPLASYQPPQPPLLVFTETCYYSLNMTYIESELDALNVTAQILGERGKNFPS